MPIRQVGDLHIFQFKSFPRSDITHGIFGRVGGVSPDPWQSLNVGGFIGDDSERVSENIRRSFDALGREVESKHDVWQVHGAGIQRAVKPRGNSDPVQADIVVTDNPGVSLFMRFADCVPILIYDPMVRVAALAHAGWKGVTLDAPGNAIKGINQIFGSTPEDLIVGLGPAVCVDCYPIGNEVADGVMKVFRQEYEDFLWQKAGQYHLNLPMACRRLLERAGVNQIEDCNICTAMNLEQWYSHRGENGRTGRFGALLALEA
jgi:YfiH family protein